MGTGALLDMENQIFFSCEVVWFLLLNLGLSCAEKEKALSKLFLENGTKLRNVPRKKREAGTKLTRERTLSLWREKKDGEENAGIHNHLSFVI